MRVVVIGGNGKIGKLPRSKTGFVAEHEDP